jgi:acetyl esterase/lipase
MQLKLEIWALRAHADLRRIASEPERARLPPTLIIVRRGTQLVDDAATAALAAVRISYIAIRIGVCWDLSNSK